MAQPIPTPTPRATPFPKKPKVKEPTLTELAIAFGGVVGTPGGPVNIEERNKRARENILRLHAAVAGVRMAETKRRREAVAGVPSAFRPKTDVSQDEAIDILKKIAAERKALKYRQLISS